MAFLKGSLFSSYLFFLFFFFSKGACLPRKRLGHEERLPNWIVQFSGSGVLSLIDFAPIEAIHHSLRPVHFAN